jgi:hypothetical protein
MPLSKIVLFFYIGFYAFFISAIPVIVCSYYLKTVPKILWIILDDSVIFKYKFGKMWTDTVVFWCKVYRGVFTWKDWKKPRKISENTASFPGNDNTRWFKYDRDWFFFVTIIAKHLLAHVSLQRTQLNYTQISPIHIRTTLYKAAFEHEGEIFPLKPAFLFCRMSSISSTWFLA